MYKPEDFEKDAFAKLIQRIRSIKKEEVSEEFDEKFFRELKTAPQKPLQLRVKNYLLEGYGYLEDFLTFRSPKLVYAMSAAVIVIMLALIVFVFQPFKMDQKPQFTEEVTPPKDTTKVDDKIKEEPKVTPEKIIKPPDTKELAKDERYFYELNKEARSGIAFAPDNKEINLIKVLTSEDFGKYLDSIYNVRKITRADTVNYLKMLYK
jgi:hypothetical protein